MEVGELIESGVFSQNQRAEHNNGPIAAQPAHGESEGVCKGKSGEERVEADQGQMRLAEGDAKNA